MTRQKKEIIKKIEQLEEEMFVDMELGCGFAPVGWYDPIYERIYNLQEELARLSHYDSVDAMLFDMRGVPEY